MSILEGKDNINFDWLMQHVLLKPTRYWALHTTHSLCENVCRFHYITQLWLLVTVTLARSRTSTACSWHRPFLSSHRRVGFPDCSPLPPIFPHMIEKVKLLKNNNWWPTGTSSLMGTSQNQCVCSCLCSRQTSYETLAVAASFFFWLGLEQTGHISWIQSSITSCAS